MARSATRGRQKATSRKSTGRKTSSRRGGSSRKVGALSAVPTTALPLDLRRRGMPAADAITDIVALAAPGGGVGVVTSASAAAAPRFQVIQTTETDAYDRRPPARLSAVAAAAKAVGDNFAGTARKAAKLSIATGQTEDFADLSDLVDSLGDDHDMTTHKPKISTAATSRRTKEEQRNVRVKAFLYAASRENDNDFHLIVGRDPDSAPELYMTMELSGLPPKSAASFKTLKAVRDVYQGFFADNLPGGTYDYYDPPIPVEVEGSLFFDMTHATGQRPGPGSLKSRMPTIWEVHPITTMVFEP